MAHSRDYLVKVRFDEEVKTLKNFIKSCKISAGVLPGLGPDKEECKATLKDLENLFAENEKVVNELKFAGESSLKSLSSIRESLLEGIRAEIGARAWAWHDKHRATDKKFTFAKDAQHAIGRMQKNLEKIIENKGLPRTEKEYLEERLGYLGAALIQYTENPEAKNKDFAQQKIQELAKLAENYEKYWGDAYTNKQLNAFVEGMLKHEIGSAPQGIHARLTVERADPALAGILQTDLASQNCLLLLPSSGDQKEYTKKG